MTGPIVGVGFCDNERPEKRRWSLSRTLKAQRKHYSVSWHRPCDDVGRTARQSNPRSFSMHWIDPDHLPEITGTLDQFLVNKHGEADGFLLTDGGEVHVPPHLSSRLLRDLRPGSQVRVRGVRPRGVQ